MSRKLAIVFLFLAAASFPCTGQSQSPKQRDLPKAKTRILFVFDASQSMIGRWERDTKFNIATRLFSNILDSLRGTPNLELALRLYGHQRYYPPGDCYDTKLEVPFSEDNTAKIKKALKSVSPKGITPIAHALSESANDFPPCENCRNIVILITDGIEECDGDPCLVSAELQRQGIILKPFIVGIGRSFEEQFSCVGSYFDAKDENEFRTALKIIISRALNPTTMQVNLLDIWRDPTETNINMTFYDHVSGKVKYNLVHAMNSKGVPDTLEIDPLVTYDIVVHTIPPVRKDSVRLTSGTHNTVGIDAPQGFLAFRAVTNATLKNMPCIIRKAGSQETTNVQQFDQLERYLTGTYDAEILCLPRIIAKDIEIRQNHTTTVEIPRPGIAVIQTTTNGYGSLYLNDKGTLIWLYNMKDNPSQMETLYLQPGDYTVVFRSKYANKTYYTIEKKFTINPGQTTNVRLYE